MELEKVEYILFDAANTIIHKPSLWKNIIHVLNEHGHIVTYDKLQINHKILSEFFQFPDRTSEQFYDKFNSDLLLSLGITPTQNLLNDIFKSCSYLPWEKFVDTDFLRKIELPIGVVSNFQSSLPSLLEKIFGNIFHDIIVSEDENLRKPDIEFYKLAIEKVGLPPEKILYIGDSIKLDIIPAKQLGINAYLIDRLNIYTIFDGRIETLYDLNHLFNIKN